MPNNYLTTNSFRSEQSLRRDRRLTTKYDFQRVKTVVRVTVMHNDNVIFGVVMVIRY